MMEHKMMNQSAADAYLSYSHNEEDDKGKVFLDEDDIICEITVDEEDLPDADDHNEGGSNTDFADLSDGDEELGGSDIEYAEEPDDSLQVFNVHTGEVYTVACSPINATLVATGGKDEKGFICRIGEGDMVLELQGHKESVSALAFSTDGQLLASGCLDGLIQVWDASSGNLKCRLEGPTEGGPYKGVEWVRWHPRGLWVLAGFENFTVWMWNISKSDYPKMFLGHGGRVTCGDFTPDGKMICTGSDDATLRIWNPKSGEKIHVVKAAGGLKCMAISSDSTLALIGSIDSSVHVVNITSGKVVSSLLAHSGSVECVGFSPSFPWAGTGGLDKMLIIWDLQHSSPRSTCYHEDGVLCLAWLGASRYIATGCMDGKVRIWDSLSGDCVRVFSGHSGYIPALALSSNGDFLVSVSYDKTARVFDISEFK